MRILYILSFPIITLVLNYLGIFTYRPANGGLQTPMHRRSPRNQPLAFCTEKNITGCLRSIRQYNDLAFATEQLPLPVLRGKLIGLMTAGIAIAYANDMSATRK